MFSLRNTYYKVSGNYGYVKYLIACSTLTWISTEVPKMVIVWKFRMLTLGPGDWWEIPRYLEHYTEDTLRVKHREDKITDI